MTRTIALKEYLQVHAVGLRGAARLWTAYALSLALKVLAPGRFEAVGHRIPGRSNLTVLVRGTLASVRPGTNDLDILAHHEPKTAFWFQVKPRDVVVDVGAHIGRYSLAAARNASKVVAIEPDPSNFAVLTANIRLNALSNVLPLSLALSDERGIRLLHIAEQDNKGTSSLEPTWSGRTAVSPPRTVGVECETLDHLVDLLGLRAIDWLKVDVEGHEVPVLEGARSTLARTRRLILEVTQGNEEACKDKTERAGLELVAVEEGSPTGNWFLVRRREDQRMRPLADLPRNPGFQSGA